MRIAFALVVLVACGDDGGSQPLKDGGLPNDGSLTDSMTDAMTDAMGLIDAPDGGIPITPTLGACAATGWCWSNPLPQGNRMVVASGTPTDLWVAGDGASVMHFDGTVWSATELPASTNDNLLAIWRAGANDVWASGPTGTFHYDGQNWAPFPTLHANSLWGATPTDIWALQFGGPHRWNGTSWTSVARPPDTLLKTVFGFAANDVWFAGSSSTTNAFSIHRWDGTTFTAAVLPASAPGLPTPRLWGSAPTDIYASNGATVMHFDGTSWTVVTGPQLSNATFFDYNSIFGSSANDVWITSQAGDRNHWDGTSWTNVKTQFSGGPFGGFAVSASERYFLGTRHFFRRHTGGVDGEPVLSGLDGALFETPDAVWAFGPNDAWFSTEQDIYHFDGTAWAISMGSPNSAIGFWGSSATNLWALRQNDNALWRYDGTTWSSATPGGTGFADYWGIWGAAASDIWIAGTNKLAHFDGTTWMETATTYRAKAISGIAANDIWVAGEATFLHYDGTSWTTVTPVGVSATSFSAIWMRTANDGWAVGGSGVISHWDGTTWTTTTLPGGTATLTGVGGTDGTHVWAVADDATNVNVYRWDGSSWAVEQIGTHVDLHAIFASPAAGAWVVGDDNIVLRLTP